MSGKRVFPATLMLVAWLLAGPFAVAASPAEQPSAAPLIERMRQGGLILYFRHTSTHRDQIGFEAQMRRSGQLVVDDCKTQRNLNDEGLRQAKLQLQAIDALQIARGETFASAYCRARQHAQIVAPQFSLLDTLTPPRDADKVAKLRQLLTASPLAGTNRWIFAHGGVLWGATDYDSVESETFVFEPVPAGQRPKLIASIRIEDWASLVRGEPCCAPRGYWRGDGKPPE